MSSAENWWATHRTAHLLVYIHMLEAHPLDAHKVRREETTSRRKERGKDADRTKVKRAAEAQRGEDHVSVHVAAPLENWRCSAKVVPVDSESIFYLSAALVSVSVPTKYHIMPSLHSFPASRTLFDERSAGRSISRFAFVIGIGWKQAGQRSLRVRVLY